VHCAPHNLQCPHAGGVVGVAHLRVLPMVPPWVCALLVLLALLPAAASAWACPSPRRFPGLAAYSCLCGFWLGYHVHEKAVLPVCACALGPWVQRMTWLPCARDGRSAAACTRWCSWCTICSGLPHVCAQQAAGAVHVLAAVCM